VRLYLARESEKDNDAITALHHGQFTRVTLIRGKTNDRGPPRPPTEAETFLIISGLMKPRAARIILVHASACIVKEKERERHTEGKRESMCRHAIAFGCSELPEVADHPDASFSSSQALRRFGEFPRQFTRYLTSGIIVFYGRHYGKRRGTCRRR